MKKYLILLLLLCSVYTVLAQTYFPFRDRAWGTNGFESQAKINHLNNVFYVTGFTEFSGVNQDKTDSSCSGPAPNRDLWIVAFDSSFIKLWDLTLGGDLHEERPSKAIPLSDGSIIISAESVSGKSCHKSDTLRGLMDLWIVKIDSNGTKIWDKSIGSNGREWNAGLISLDDHACIIASSTNGGISGDKTSNGLGGTDLWVIKIDSSGSKVWDKTYGGNSNEPILSTNAILLGHNRQIIITASSFSSQSGSITDSTNGLIDCYITAIDTAGNLLWNKLFGGPGVDRGVNTAKSQDGYIIACYTESGVGGDISSPSIGQKDLWIIKIDTSGNLIWDKRFGGLLDEIPWHIEVALNGDIWISSTTNSPAGFDISENPLGPAGDIWILVIDSNGQKLWDKRLGPPLGSGDPGNFLIMNDGSVYLSSNLGPGTTSTKADSGRGGLDYWVVHFNYTSTGITDLVQPRAIRAYPNPAASFIELNGLPLQPFTWQWFTADGRLAGSGNSRLSSGTQRFEMNGFAPGLYALLLQGSGWKHSIKVLKE